MLAEFEDYVKCGRLDEGFLRTRCGSCCPRRYHGVFGIQIEGCTRCGGKLRFIASIEEPQVIAKIHSHLQRTAPQPYQCELPLGATRR